MHWLASADQKVSVVACEHFKFASVILSLLVKEVKFEDGERLLDSSDHVVCILCIARLQKADAKAKIQLRELGCSHELNG